MVLKETIVAWTEHSEELNEIEQYNTTETEREEKWTKKEIQHEITCSLEILSYLKIK